MAVVVGTMVMSAAITVLLAARRVHERTSLTLEASVAANGALARMAHGVGTNYGVRSAMRSSLQLVSADGNWTLSYAAPGGPTNRFDYSRSRRSLSYYDGADARTVIADNVTTSSVAVADGVVDVAITVEIKEGDYYGSSTAETALYARNS